MIDFDIPQSGGDVTKAYVDDNKIDKTEKGVADGVATLGADGKVPAAQLPPGGGGSGSVVTDSATNGNIVVDGVETNVYTHPATHAISEVDGLQLALDGKEPSFTKNTAFNKDLGTTADTVAEGNHTHADLHNHSNKADLDRLSVTVNNQLAIDGVEQTSGGGSGSSNAVQKSVLGVAGASQSTPYSVTIPVTSDPSFRTKALEVLNNVPGSVDQMITQHTFDNAQSSDWQVNEYITHDGTAHLKTEHINVTTALPALPSSNIHHKLSFTKNEFKSIIKMEVL